MTKIHAFLYCFFDNNNNSSFFEGVRYEIQSCHSVPFLAIVTQIVKDEFGVPLIFQVLLQSKYVIQFFFR